MTTPNTYWGPILPADYSPDGDLEEQEPIVPAVEYGYCQHEFDVETGPALYDHWGAEYYECQMCGQWLCLQDKQGELADRATNCAGAEE